MGEQSEMVNAIQDNNDLMVTYEIMSHLRKQRQTYPHPHQQFDRSSHRPKTFANTHLSEFCKPTQVTPALTPIASLSVVWVRPG